MSSDRTARPGVQTTSTASIRPRMAGLNWAGNHRYRARRLHRPSTLDELRAIVAAAPRIRALGTRHAFNDMADSAELVSLENLPRDVVVDGRTVSFGAATTYAELAVELDRAGVALHNLASLPHTTVAGAVATATHGSGDADGNLATAVAGLELVTSTGDIVTVTRGDAGFDGMVVGLGALGVVTRLTLDVEPAYQVRQRVFENLTWEALAEHFDEITAAGDSVSVFSRLGETTEQVWVKTRVTGEPEDVRSDLFGAPAATVDRHPIVGLDPIHATQQLGRPGLWWDRLPHFRAGFTPSAGDELQTERLVPREHAVAAIEAVRELAPPAAPLLQVCEIRTIAADRHWMSPQYERDTVGIHFTLKPEPEAVHELLAGFEAALAPFDARPHWAKLFRTPGRYERLPEFLALAERLDPRGAFRNDWFERVMMA